MKHIHRTVFAGIAASAVALASPCVSASPTFTIDPSAIPGTVKPLFNATDLTGLSSALITELTGGGGPGSTQSEAGWVNFIAFSNNNTVITGNASGLGNTYQLFLTFNATSQTTIGTVGSANNQNPLTSLTFTVFADPLFDDLTTNASVSPTVQPTVSDPGANDIVLATGDLINGVASFNSNGGPALNAIAAFAVCTGFHTADVGGTPVADGACLTGTGSLFFAAPIPFFSLAFTESNTTPTNVATDPGFPGAGSHAAIVSDSTQVNFAAVPEPASLALLGSALFGFGVFGRRTKRRTRA